MLLRNKLLQGVEITWGGSATGFFTWVVLTQIILSETCAELCLELIFHICVICQCGPLL